MKPDDKNKGFDLNEEDSIYVAKRSKLIKESLKNLYINMDVYLTKIQSKLRDNNWFFTSSMDAHLWNYVSDNIDQQKNIESFLNKAFVSYFSSDNFDYLDYMVEQWNHNQLLSDRFHILKECVSVLKDSTNEKSNIKNPHYLIIPTLIAQIEGSMTNYLLKNNFEYARLQMKNMNTGEKGDKNTLFKEEVFTFLKAEYAKGSSISVFLQEEGNTAIHILSDILFKDALPEKKISDLKFPLSRHKIMHGQHLRYGNIEDTIRLFLLLDFIASLSRKGTK